MTYERQIATAKRLITKYGQACTWREPGAPTGPANNPTPGLPIDYSVNIAFLSNANREGLAGLLSMFTDTEVPTSGVRGLMPAQPFTPTLMGKVARQRPFAAPGLNIVDKNGIDALNINGEIILYFLRFAG